MMSLMAFGDVDVEAVVNVTVRGEAGVYGAHVIIHVVTQELKHDREK